MPFAYHTAAQIKTIAARQHSRAHFMTISMTIKYSLSTLSSWLRPEQPACRPLEPLSAAFSGIKKPVTEPVITYVDEKPKPKKAAYVPTHAASSFLKTTTSWPMRQANEIL